MGADSLCNWLFLTSASSVVEFLLTLGFRLRLVRRFQLFLLLLPMRCGLSRCLLSVLHHRVVEKGVGLVAALPALQAGHTQPSGNVVDVDAADGHRDGDGDDDDGDVDEKQYVLVAHGQSFEDC